MNWTVGKMAAATLALGVMVSGCATRESVEQAQASANGADRHAGVAMSRADEAFGVGNKESTVFPIWWWMFVFAVMSYLAVVYILDFSL